MPTFPSSYLKVMKLETFFSCGILIVSETSQAHNKHLWNKEVNEQTSMAKKYKMLSIQVM